MTRFDAAEPTDRRKLYVDAITAHRTRASPFLTLEVDESALEADTDADVADGDATDEDDSPAQSTGGGDEAADLGTPWLQFGDGIVNLDCTDAELEALKALLDEFPAFKIDEVTRPEDVDGVNVRVSARADPNRIAQFFDAVLQRVYGLPETGRVWVVEL